MVERCPTCLDRETRLIRQKGYIGKLRHTRDKWRTRAENAERKLELMPQDVRPVIHRMDTTDLVEMRHGLKKAGLREDSGFLAEIDKELKERDQNAAVRSSDSGVADEKGT